MKVISVRHHGHVKGVYTELFTCERNLHVIGCTPAGRAHSVDATLVVVFVEQRQASDGSESLGLQIECESLQVGRVGEHKIVVVEDFCRLVVCLVVGGEYRERRLWHRDVILVAATKVRELVGDGRRLLGGRIEDTVK